jgi:hypothetical protein
MTTSLISEFHRAERRTAMGREYTRRQFLTYMLITDGVEARRAEEMVREVAESRPELDMDESLTWAAWLRLAKAERGHDDHTPPPRKGRRGAKKR